MKVLVAIDTSPSSQRLLEEAAARPWPAGTEFCVLTAIDIFGFGKLPALIADAKREGELLVKAGAAVLTAANQRAIAQVAMGAPRKVIPEYAAEWRADMILVGSHGHGAVGRFLLGSVAQGVLRTAPCTVEIVRFPSSGSAPTSHPLKVLFATDGSECSVAALHSVTTRPWPARTAFRVLSVEEILALSTPIEASSLASIYPATLLEELLADARTRAKEAVEDARKALLEAGLVVLEPQPIPIGDPRAVVLDVAQAWSADLIVLGSHGRRGLDRFLMGSVAESVAMHAHCSVEVIRK